jgi:putative transposase
MQHIHWCLDLFRTESIPLRSHWVLVIMDQFTRRIIGFCVQAGSVDGPALCGMYNRAISDEDLPIRLSTDHDPLFKFHRWQGNLRILDVERVQIVPEVSWSYPFIERLIAIVRPEHLDRLFFYSLSLLLLAPRQIYPATRPERNQAARHLR